MDYTRRDVGKIALSAIPAAALLNKTTAADAAVVQSQARPNSLINGVQIGVIIPYSFGQEGGDAANLLWNVVKLGISAVELQAPPAEAFVGATAPAAGGGRGGGGGAPGGGRGGPGAGCTRWSAGTGTGHRSSRASGGAGRRWQRRRRCGGGGGGRGNQPPPTPEEQAAQAAAQAAAWKRRSRSADGSLQGPPQALQRCRCQHLRLQDRA